MRLGGKPMRPMKLMQWIGVAVAALGAALMLNSGPLSQVWMSAHLPSGFPVHLDWLFLIGIATTIGGGLLVQITWRTLPT
jgi:hypothetical protein